VEGFLELLRLGIEEGLPFEAAAGVVDHDVDPAEVVNHPVDQSGEVLDVADVDGTGHRDAASGLNFGGDLVDVALGASGHRDGRAGTGQGARDLGTDTATAASDDRDAVLQRELVHARGLSLRCAGYTQTGSVSQPRVSIPSVSLAPSSSTTQSGNRSSVASRTTRISSLASAAPRQKCGPNENVRI
jgi:hypothetical protein